MNDYRTRRRPTPAPTTPGWYYAQTSDTAPIEPVRVCKPDAPMLIVEFVGTEKSVHVEQILRWFGPVSTVQPR